MTPFSKTAIGAVAVGLAAVVGLGAYQAGRDKEAQRCDSMAVSQQPAALPVTPNAAPVAAPGATLTPAALNAPVPTVTATPAVPVGAMATPVPNNGVTVTTPPGYPVAGTTSNGLVRETAVTDHTYVSQVPRTAVVVPQRQVVVQKRVVYRRHIAYRHDTGKIHMHRAVKHTATFVAKLPFKMRL